MSEPSYLRTTRAAYDTVAVDYAELLSTELAAKPLDRALLAAFAELVHAAGGGPVADLGCHPGRVTAHLHSLGLSAFGVDLSPAMVAVARRAHQGLRFDKGSMSALDLTDGVLGGIRAWYSIIHTPPARLPVVFAEFYRVLSPGGHLLLAFQVGDECVHLKQAYGHTMSLDAYRLSPDRVAELLSKAGLVVHARLIREPERNEKIQQAYLLARKPVAQRPTAEILCAASESERGTTCQVCTRRILQKAIYCASCSISTRPGTTRSCTVRRTRCKRIPAAPPSLRMSTYAAIPTVRWIRRAPAPALAARPRTPDPQSAS